MFRLYKYLGAKFKTLSWLAVILTLIQVGAFLVVPIFIGQMNGLIAQQTYLKAHNIPDVFESTGQILRVHFSYPSVGEALKWMGIFFTIFLIIGTISSVLSSLLASYVNTAGARQIRSYLWKHLGELSEKDIEAFSHAKILTRFTIDINRIQVGLMSLLRTMIIGPLNLVFGIVFSLLTDLKLSIVLGVLIPVLAITIITSGFVIAPLFKKEQKLYDSINNESQENILGAKVIKSYNLEMLEAEKFENVNLNWRKVSRKSWLSYNATFNSIGLFANLAVALILYVVGINSVGIKDPEQFKNTITNATTFINYVTYITVGVVMSSFVIFNIFRANVSSKRILEILDKQPDIKYVVSDKKVTEGKISFENVTFRYYENSEKNVLEDISFTINPGEILGIIGPTGSGKSTIAKLINLDFKSQYGLIKIDNNDIREIDTTSLRQNISHVYQKPALLSGTIKTNLLFAKPDASEEEIIQATKNACAYEYINRFKEKFEHHVEQKGANLSGGQKQRLSIAQGIIRRPKILILDDSTSALDAKTEAQVRSNIRQEFAKDKITTVIIAQKISSIIDADQILVMEKGKIIGRGTHEELMKTNDFYREIATLQLGGDNV
ncbi:ABC transporter ATP-binding protein [Metamycoplasma neophronis]|uniref:ABC transporter ATP-binding protein n=1 Tax=Metamycoplasma neophronis TaxID=872983 RepID=A0ABY2Z052_9BACT|nr:ABC transporter ATP-binding protein [Metamycoplasma neophronis]TPR53899.1 ABC transporter ATP-binding protein [Metamycoplasma neophronis]